jgi:hypothetical protein
MSMRVSIFRSANTGTIEAGADEQLFSMAYDMSANVQFPNTGTNTLNQLTKYPLVIYSYRVTCVGLDFHGHLYQTYGDTDDIDNLTNFDIANDEFVSGLKQVRMFSGTSTTQGKSVITYSAKKNPRSKRARYGKWRRPPIVLGPRAGNYFNISVQNNSASDMRNITSLVEIISWKQFT